MSYETNKAWKQNNPDKVKAYRKKWRAENPDYARQWREKHPGYKTHWNQKNPDKVAVNNGRYLRKLRAAVLAHYGGKCVCCGEDRSLFLELDHVNNDGKTHRNQTGADIARYLFFQNYPAEFEIQILCANCHRAKTSIGRCPYHQ